MIEHDALIMKVKARGSAVRTLSIKALLLRTRSSSYFNVHNVLCNPVLDPILWTKFHHRI